MAGSEIKVIISADNGAFLNALKECVAGINKLKAMPAAAPAPNMSGYEDVANKIKTVAQSVKDLAAAKSIKISVDGQQATTTIAQVRGALEAIKNITVNVRVNRSGMQGLTRQGGPERIIHIGAESTAAVAAINDISNRLRALKSLNIKITADIAQAATAIAELTGVLNGIRSKRINVKLSTRQAIQNLARLAAAINEVRNRLNDLRLPPGLSGSINLAQFNAMLAVLRQIEASARQTAENTNRIGGNIGGASGASEGLLSRLANISLVGSGIASIFASIKSTAASIAMPGFNFVKDMETAQLGIAGTLSSMTLLNGKAMDFSSAMGISADMMKKLQRDAILTSATTADMVTTFRALLAPGIGAGMSLDEIEEFTKVGVNAVKAMGLDSTQFVQELRDLVQGGIAPASSTLATSLGLTDADIKAAKASADGLYKFLMNRLAGYAPMAERFPDTLAGKMSMLEETFTMASAKLTNAFKPAIKDILGDLAEMIGEFNTKTGELDLNPNLQKGIDGLISGFETLKELAKDLAEQFGAFDVDGTFYMSTETLDLLNQMGDTLDHICTLAKDIGGAGNSFVPILESIISRVLQWVDAFLQVADIIANAVCNAFKSTEDHLDTTKKLINYAVDALFGFFIISKITFLAEGLVGVFKAMKLAVIAVRTAIVTTSGAVATLKAVLMALGKTPVLILLSLIVAAFGGTMLSLADKIGELTGMGLKDDETKPAEDVKPPPEKPPEEEKPKQDVTSKYTTRSQREAAEKAEKERIKASQQALKDFKEMLKYQRESTLLEISEQRAALEREHKANPNGDEREYLIKLSQLDLDEAGIKLSTAEQVRGKIEAAAFEREQDKVNELNNINLDIKKLKIALNNAAENLEQLGANCSDSGEAIFSAAEKFLGFDYVMGGDGLSKKNGTDCGKLTLDAYAAAGIALARRTADAQLAQMEDVGGFYTDPQKLKRGDLVFYDTKYMPVVNDRAALNENNRAYKANHVGIYQGDGKIIHAGSSTGVAENIDINMARIIGFGDHTALGGKAGRKQIKATQDKAAQYAEFIEKLLKEGDDILQEAASLAGDASNQEIGAIRDKYDQIIEKFKNNHMPEKYIQAAEKVKSHKVSKIEFDQATKDIELIYRAAADKQRENLNDVAAGIKSALDAVNESVAEYEKGIKDKREKLKELLQAAKDSGRTEFANTIKDELDKIDLNIIQFYADELARLDEVLDNRLSLIDSDPRLTSLQKQDLSDQARRSSLQEQIGLKREQLKTYYEQNDFQSAALAANEIQTLQNQLAQLGNTLDQVHFASKQAFEDGLLDFLERGILECESLGDAFRNLAITILQAINKVYSEALTKNIMSALGLGAGSASGGSNGFSPTFGFDMNNPLGLSGHAEGGEVNGPGTETSDSIIARLSRGEFVIRAAAVKKVGTDFLHRLNSGDIYNLRIPTPKFAAGGAVGRIGAAGASKGMEMFSQDIGMNVSPRLSIHNYVDGQRVFDAYGKPLIRSEARKEYIENMKLFSQLGKRV